LLLPLPLLVFLQPKTFVISTEAKRSGEIPVLVVAVALAVAVAVALAVVLAFAFRYPKASALGLIAPQKSGL